MTKSVVQPSSPASSGRGAATRHRLVQATVEVVAEQGWDGATTRAIAERAGAQQALINYHFGSKDRLLQAAVEEALREGFADPVRALVAAPDFVDGCVLLARQLSELDRGDPVVRFAMEAMSRAPRDPRVASAMADLLSELRELLSQGIAAAQRRGEVTAAVDPSGLATLLAAIFDGLGLHLLIDRTIEMRRAETALRALLAREED